MVSCQNTIYIYYYFKQQEFRLFIRSSERKENRMPELTIKSLKQFVQIRANGNIAKIKYVSGKPFSLN